MKIEKIQLGELRVNCYFIINTNNECIIVDPGAEAEKIIQKANKYKVKGILVTHSHDDHIGALKEIEKEYDLSHNPKNIENFEYIMINTPGHRFDSITFYFEKEKIMFTGDFLFKDTFGRIDLDGSNTNEMVSSLKLIKNYPSDITIFPGHGNESNLGYEKNNIDNYINYYFDN